MWIHLVNARLDAADIGGAPVGKALQAHSLVHVRRPWNLNVSCVCVRRTLFFSRGLDSVEHLFFAGGHGMISLTIGRRLAADEVGRGGWVGACVGGQVRNVT